MTREELKKAIEEDVSLDHTPGLHAALLEWLAEEERHEEDAEGQTVYEPLFPEPGKAQREVASDHLRLAVEKADDENKDLVLPNLCLDLVRRLLWRQPGDWQ